MLGRSVHWVLPMPSPSDSKVSQLLSIMREGLARLLAWAKLPVLLYSLWWAAVRLLERG